MKVILAYIGVIIVWSTTPLGVKISVSGGDPFAPLVGRTAIGLWVTLMCLAFLSERVRFSAEAWRVYASSTLSVVGAMLLTYQGAAYIPSGMIAVIYGLSPIVTGLLAVPLLGEPRLNRVQLLGVSIAMLGLGWIFHAEIQLGGQSWLGILYLLGAVLLYSASTVLVKYFNTDLQPLTVNAGSLLLSLPLMLLLSDGADYQALVADSRILVTTVYLGLVGSFLGFVLYFFVLQSMSATQVMMVPLVTPVLALGIGSLWNGETVTAETLYGSLVVLVGLGVYLLHHWLLPSRELRIH